MVSALTYLDYNATTPLRPEARTAVLAALDEGGNPSAVHGAGRRARARVEAARLAVARVVNAPAESVIFTSGATEANALAISGVLAAGLVDELMISAGEHDSVRAMSAAAGVPVRVVPLDRDGLPDLDGLDGHLAALEAAGRRALVSIMLANNETGVIAPLADIVRRVRARGDHLVHTDAVQAVGRVPVDMAALGVDMLSLSGHKLGAPTGVGALIVRPGLAPAPVLRGGGQETGRRAGTENVAAIAGLGAAVDAAVAHMDTEAGRLSGLRDRLEERLRQIDPAVVIFAAATPRLSNTSMVGRAGLAAETQVMALDLAGVAVSSGAACSSGKVASSHVLEAMGAGPDLAGAAIRVSLGWQTTDTDIDAFVTAWAAHQARTLGRRDTGNRYAAAG